MRVISAWLVLAAALVGGHVPVVSAASEPPSPRVRIELVSEVQSIAPGETFWVGLRQRIAPGWHTYWMNPGDSGEPPRIEWTNHLCPYVQKHYETSNMQALQKDATGQGVIWLTIISSAPDTQGYVLAKEADELTRTRSASPTALLLDPTGVVGKMYGATNTPHMYVVDKTGTLVYAGAIDDKPTTRRSDVKIARNYVREALQAVAAGQPVKTPVTRAYGCTVKYA